MASADCSSALTEKLSPGKVQNLPPRAVRLYRVRLGWLLGFAVPSQLAARTRPHCRFVYLRSRVLLRASFSFTSRLRLAFRYGCRHRLRLGSFHPTRFCPSLGTLGQALSPANPGSCGWL